MKSYNTKRFEFQNNKLPMKKSRDFLQTYFLDSEFHTSPFHIREISSSSEFESVKRREAIFKRNQNFKTSGKIRIQKP